jgi:hypothetical protein
MTDRLPMPEPKLLDQVRQTARLKHFSLRTEHAYAQWVHRLSGVPRQAAPRVSWAPARSNRSPPGSRRGVDAQLQSTLAAFHEVENFFFPSQSATSLASCPFLSPPFSLGAPFACV